MERLSEQYPGEDIYGRYCPLRIICRDDITVDTDDRGKTCMLQIHVIEEGYVEYEIPSEVYRAIEHCPGKEEGDILVAFAQNIARQRMINANETILDSPMYVSLKTEKLDVSFVISKERFRKLIIKATRMEITVAELYEKIKEGSLQ